MMTASTLIKNVVELKCDSCEIPKGWNLRAVINDDNMTYVIWNDLTREAIVVDPMQEDLESILSLIRGQLSHYRFLAVIDTHTHADHISCAAHLAESLHTPLIQHALSPSKRIHLRVHRDTAISSSAAPLHILMTPGHTADSITPIWGPFILGGDTLLYGDTGRDDLPGGDPVAHWESLQKIKAFAQPEMILLPGHDSEGGRISYWKTQLEINSSLNQDQKTFVNDAGSYVGPSPKLLKESLYYNFK